MRIAGNAAVFPEFIVTNDDICRQVREYSTGLKRGSIDKIIENVEQYLLRMGARNRRWTSALERPIELITQATDIALEKSELDKKLINNVIYCSVDRVLLEPANAALLSSQLNIPTARAFDVSHACQGWFTALQISGDRADFHNETSLILSAEFPMTEGGVARPKNFDLGNAKDREWKLASFLLGEAATATIILPGGKRLSYSQRNDNLGFIASYVRLPQAERFLKSRNDRFEVAEMTFYTNSKKLLDHGLRVGFDVFDDFDISRIYESTIIPHTVSSRLIYFLNRRFQSDMDVVDIFPEFGNVGSASLAAGLQYHTQHKSNSSAANAHPVLGWMIAAGMSASIFEFPLSQNPD